LRAHLLWAVGDSYRDRAISQGVIKVGTNYYYEHVSSEPCPTCGRGGETEQLHIGKSSVGWVFSLRIHPNQGIKTLEDWKARWAHGGQIRDEYGEFVSVDEMLNLITQRSHSNGLRRHKPDPAFPLDCQPGEGTYDYCNYEFS